MDGHLKKNRDFLNPAHGQPGARDYFLTDIVQCEEDGQVRKNGASPHSLNKIEKNIYTHGQQVPITLRKSKKREGKYEIIDGNHRFMAFQSLNEQYPDGIFNCIKSYVDEDLDTATSLEIQNYQLRSNEHEPSINNSDGDWARLIALNLKEARYGKDLSWEKYHDSPENFDKLYNILKDDWSEFSHAPSTLKSWIGKAVAIAPGNKFKSDQMKTLARQLGRSSVTKWSGTKAGLDSKHRWLGCFGDQKHIYPNVAGHGVREMISNKGVEITYLLNCADLCGKSHEDVDAWRRNMTQAINDLNKGLMELGLIRPMINEVIFAGQKVGENSEQGFLRVKKKSNGDFDVNSIPTNGWSEK